MKQVQEHSSAGVKVILIGNKSDLPPEERKVSFQEGKDEAMKYDIPFYEVSAKMNENITECFTELGELIVNDIKDNEEKYTNTKLTPGEDKPDKHDKKKKC